MRLLLLADSLQGGGAERQLALFAEHLPQSVDARVWSLLDGPFLAVLQDSGVPVLTSVRSRKYDVSATLALWSVLRSWRPDVVHAWGWRAAAEAVPACLALRVPLVHGAIRSAIVTRGRLWPPRYTLAVARLIVANSHAGLEAWRVGPRKGRVVYNAFDHRRLAALPARTPGAGSFTVVMTGRMSSQKDYQTVVATARLLGAQEPRAWRFELVGQGPDRANLMEGSQDLVRAGVIDFPEAGLEVMGRVGQADVGVLMTDPRHHREGCSNSIMEYMAAGLPVVCSESGGNRELVVDGVTGSLVQPRDPAALAKRLVFLRDHPEDRRRMGEAGRRRILEHFAVEKMVSAYLAIYEEVTATRGTRAP